MKRILISILLLLFFTHVSEAQLLPATVKKPTPPAVQKPTSKPVQHKPQRTLKDLVKQSKITLVPVMDQVTTLWGFEDSATGKFLVSCQFDWADSMIDGMAIVNRGKRFGFINQFGEEIVPLIYEFIYRYKEGFSRVKLNGKFCLINRKGEILNGTMDTYNVTNMINGFAVQYLNGAIIKCGTINTKGNVIIPFEYDKINPFIENVTAFKLNQRWGLINKQGEKVVSPIYDIIGQYSEGLTHVRLDNKSGYMDNSGNFIIPLQYDMASLFKNGRAFVLKGGKWSLIDKYGIPVTNTTFSDYNLFEEKMASVKVGEKWGMIDLNGNWVIAPKFDSLGTTMNGGYIPAKIGYKWGVIDKGGNVSVLNKYDKIESFSEGLAAVRLTNKWGFINTNGVEVIPAKYESAENFIDGIAQIKLRGRIQYIDKTGKVLTD